MSSKFIIVNCRCVIPTRRSLLDRSKNRLNPRSADLGWFLLAWNAITEQGHFCERARYAAPPPLLERNEMLPTDPLIELSGVRKAVRATQIR